MRDQGRLVEWFDDKGYGFIQPNDASKIACFLHCFAQGARLSAHWNIGLAGWGRAFRATGVPQTNKKQKIAQTEKCKRTTAKIKSQIYCYIFGFSPFGNKEWCCLSALRMP